MISACRASSSRRGSSPYIPATSLPWSPIHSWPLVSNGHAAGSATSLGRAGLRLPSRHTTFTSGRLPFAAKLYVMREHAGRSEEHTSELQSHVNLVCRLLLEKK